MKHQSNPRYVIEKDEYIPDGLDCTHPLCDRFHRNGCPTPTRVEWLIIDNSTGNRANINNQNTYRRKRDAVAALNVFLARQDKDVKRQQIVDSLIRSFNADRPIVREVRFEDIAGGGDDADQA